MSVSEFRYAVYSGRVWNECVELDDELFLVDEGEGLCLSIMKYFYLGTVGFNCFFNYNFFHFLFLMFLYSDYYLELFISPIFFQQDFEKMELYLFHRGKVDSLFVVVGGNCICHRCVFGDYNKYCSHEYQIGFLGW